jgi:hypothetical protein
MGMQIVLLYVEAGIKFFDAGNWSFGQVVAISIWFPPAMEYLWWQLSKFQGRCFDGTMANFCVEGMEKAAEYRLARELKLVRVDHRLPEKMQTGQAEQPQSDTTVEMGKLVRDEEEAGNGEEAQLGTTVEMSKLVKDEEET